MVYDRVDRMSSILREEELSALIVFSPKNMIYLTGHELDYSALVLLSDGSVNVVTRVLEYERARDLPSVSGVYPYSPYRMDASIDYYLGGLEEALAYTISKLGIEGKVGYEGYHVAKSRIDALERLLGSNVKLVDASDAIWRSRLVKVESEIELIRKSASILSKAMTDAIEHVSVGRGEHEVAAAAVYRLMLEGGYTEVYPIVASGHRAALPHGRATRKVVERGDPVVIDLTCKFKGYYSDMTRTVFAGAVPGDLEKIYEAVREAQEEALDHVREGVIAREVDEAARGMLRRRGLDRHFIHSTGHSIGLDVHEPLRLSGSEERVLREGMVVTVEPGVYIRGVGGVRIEDTVIVRKGKPEVLTSYIKDVVVR